MMAMNCSILSVAPGQLEDEMVDGRVDDVGAEGVGEAKRLDAPLALAGDLDQRQLALERPALGREVVDAVHRHHAAELRP